MKLNSILWYIPTTSAKMKLILESQGCPGLSITQTLLGLHILTHSESCREKLKGWTSDSVRIWQANTVNRDTWVLWGLIHSLAGISRQRLKNDVKFLYLHEYRHISWVQLCVKLYICLSLMPLSNTRSEKLLIGDTNSRCVIQRKLEDFILI